MPGKKSIENSTAPMADPKARKKPGSDAIKEFIMNGGQKRSEVFAKTQVYAHLKGQLINGLYASEEWLRVDAIAAQLGISRQPVMDAIKRLSVEGFIEIVPQVGSRIRRYERQDLHDFFEFFSLCESYVARLAAERSNPDDIVGMRLTSAQLNALPRLQKSPGDVAKLYRVLNRNLHSQISTMASSHVISEMVEALRDRADFFITTYSIIAGRLEDAVVEHEAIIDAIEERNADKVATLMKRHILAFDPSFTGGK